MDAEFGRFLTSLGVGGALAGVIFYFHTKITEQHRVDLKDLLIAQTKREDVFVRVIQENTASNTKLITVIEAFAGRREGAR